MDIKDKVVIVTGASEGIGKSIAEKLAHGGAKVVLAARSEEKLKSVAQGMSDVLIVPTDMKKLQDIRNLIHQATEKYGRIDIFINNAGRGLYGPLETVDVEQYKDIMDLNVFSVMRAMQLVIPIMRKQGGGMILNISSRVSKNYFPNLSAYASTKYALNALSLTARAELEKDHIIVSVFHPRMTATNFGKNAMGTRPNASSDNRHTGQTAPGVDTADQVAEKVLEQIKSEEAEASMDLTPAEARS